MCGRRVRTPHLDFGADLIAPKGVRARPANRLKGWTVLFGALNLSIDLSFQT